MPPSATPAPSGTVTKPVPDKRLTQRPTKPNPTQPLFLWFPLTVFVSCRHFRGFPNRHWDTSQKPTCKLGHGDDHSIGCPRVIEALKTGESDVALGPVSWVSAGGIHSAAVLECGRVFTWGGSSYGQVCC